MRKAGFRLMAAVGVIVAILAAATPAQAAFDVTGFDGEVLKEDGSAASQAGSHPSSAAAQFDLAARVHPLFGFPVPSVSVRDTVVELPPGLIGNPQGFPQCVEQQLAQAYPGRYAFSMCPPDSQVGNVQILWSAGQETQALYSMVPPRGVAAAFGFVLADVKIHLYARVRNDGDYGVTVDVPNISEAIPIVGTKVTFWGVPNHPRHNGQRAEGSEMPPRAFLSNPTACTAPGEGLETRLFARAWDGTVDTASFISHDVAPNQDTPLGPTGCDAVPFEPSARVDLESSQPGAPTGMEFDLSFPQDVLHYPDALATAHLRKAKVALPEGLTVNPAAAGGLQACADDQLNLRSAAPMTCPEGAKIGTATATTPVLEETMTGAVYVRTQASSDPESGDMFRVALVLQNDERGIDVRLPGSISADARTGRLVATFDNNPQLPVGEVKLQLKEGPRAPLALPRSGGEKTVATELTAWSGKVADLGPAFAVDCTPGLGRFTPSFSAGVVSPTAAASSPFSMRVRKADEQEDVEGVELSLPQGLLANLKGAVGQRIGTARVAAGPGRSPFWLDGPVVLEGPYGSAPFSLRVTVPAVAGPFDLGEVVVRQKIHVDPETAAVRVVSDPLPTVVKGVPARLQDLVVDVDRPGFVLNPTDCREQAIDGALVSASGQRAGVSTRFQVADCQGLAFKPRMAMRLSGKRQTRTGGHPAFSTTLRQGKGQANIGAVKVTMPSSIALDANNSYDKALVCDYDKAQQADCPASSIIGKATAYTPVLNRPLSGPVHLVQGIKFGPKGNRIRTTPALLVKLRGEVAVNLRGQTTTEKGTNRLVTTFARVPDAPVSRFDLKINGGKKGILTVTRTRKAKIDLCRASQIAAVETDGQNGKRADFQTRVKTPCAKAAKAKRSR